MQLPKDKLVKLLDRVSIGCHADTESILGQDKGNVCRIKPLPHCPETRLGYQLSKASSDKIELIGLSIQEGTLNVQICVELRPYDRDTVEIVSLRDNDETIDLNNEDAINRTLGKLALQIEYVNSLPHTLIYPVLKQQAA